MHDFEIQSLGNVISCISERWFLTFWGVTFKNSEHFMDFFRPQSLHFFWSADHKYHKVHMSASSYKII